ncbi:tobamovirus multiplication protein 1-like isoform x1 [Anaeramoeba flamelloides]|uniref:Tobamovirus multiplication protein 1-like isoform x1 n=1 Tax=Anaeramoeba flamelloides TaxID=1746091 RepID=A0ABQ8XVA2_9EUKA|nr:tobamovirus multiplication protein 1-like isoform x1 [Anaeramoeba flamelloides]
MTKLIYNKDVVISLFSISFFYFVVAIISMVRLYWLITRVKNWIYQKVKVLFKALTYHKNNLFFVLVILACCGRIPILLIQIFIDPKTLIEGKAFKICDSLTSDLFISSFLLIIFAVTHIYFQHVGRTSRQQTLRSERVIIILLVIFNVILVTVSLILGSRKSKTILDLYIFDIVAFLVIAFGLLISSIKLLYHFRKRKELMIYSQIKTLFRVVLACTILHLVRIPLILVLLFKEKEWFKKPWEDALYIFFYFLLTELLAICLIIFFLFEIPPKSGEFQEVNVQSYDENSLIINSDSEGY